MTMSNDVTQLLGKIERGEIGAEAIIPQIYDELRKLASAKLRREKAGQTLQATALVNEACLRLLGPNQSDHWNNSRHFFAAAAEAMRRILIEQARSKGRQKRGGDFTRVSLSQVSEPAAGSSFDVLDLNQAITELEIEHPRKAELVKLRYFGGLTQKQAAEVLDVSTTTADQDWAFARAWLRLKLER
jgi:RNA polymerase sigma factor (TIGR02999 family)